MATIPPCGGSAIPSRRHRNYLVTALEGVISGEAREAARSRTPAIAVEKGDDSRPTYEKALSSNRPVLVDVVMDDAIPVKALQDEYRPFAPVG